jgi:holin-like protein
MKYMKQFGIILIVTCVGEFLHHFLPLPIPGSIYGLVLMLVLLCTHALHIEDVKDTAEFLIEIMPLMFIPAAVGLLTAWTDLKPVLIPILVITVVSTVLVMGVTGTVTQAIMRLRKRQTSHTDAIISAEVAQERHERNMIPLDRRLRLKIKKQYIRDKRWRRDHFGKKS